MKNRQFSILASVLFSLLISASVFAQTRSGTSKTNMSSTSAPGAKGFVAGLVYSNLSDSKSESHYKFYSNGTKMNETSETNHQGLHLGLYGLNIGYKDIYAFGSWGFNTGLQILRGLNGSEAPSSLNVYKILGDAVLPVTDNLALSAGLNFSYFAGLADQSENNITLEPGFGAQIGAEYRLSQISLLVGAQVLSLKQKWSWSGSDSDTNSTYKSEGEANYLVSGFITQVSYTF